MTSPRAPSYASGTSSVALLGETIGEILARIAATLPEHEALVECWTGRRWTYAELDRAVDDVAAGLLEAGLAQGDRVGIWSPSCAEWTITQFATARIGAVLVTINPAYRTRELSYALNQSGCAMLISATEFKISNYVEMISAVRSDCPDLRHVVFIGTPDWDALAAPGRGLTPVRDQAAALTFDDPINIQYTSGTTGFPKGATLSHHNIANNGFFVGEVCGYTDADRVCIPVPFYHCFGMVMGNLGAVTHGATMVIPAPSFEPAATLKSGSG